MMAPTDTTELRIPLIYRLWFTWIDPVLSIPGVYFGLFKPELLLRSFIPATIPNRAAPDAPLPNPDAVVNPAQAMIFNQLAGFLLATAVLSCFMLRSTNDLTVWKYYQGAICLVDFVILVAMGLEYSQQGRLSPLTWRQEDWFSVLLTAVCALLRSSFVLGIGLDKKRKTN
jgi:hypothetical protein